MATAPTALPLFRMGPTRGHASTRPTISQTVMHRRRRPEATHRPPVAITRRPRAITVAVQAATRPRLRRRIREAGLMAISSSRRISRMAADIIARRTQDYAYYGPNQGNTAPVDGRRTARPSGPAVADASRGKMVRLAPGETILSLAKRHGVTVEAIARANGLRGGPIMPGTMLVIPAAAAPTQYGQAPSAPRAKVAECTGAQCYTVQRGETVGAIARAHGLTEQQLLEANNLPDARSLRAGQSIAIPGQTAPRQAMASATPQNRTAPRAGHASAPAAPASDSEGTLQEAEQVKPSTEVKMTTTKQTEPTCEAALANPLPRMGKTFRKPVEGLVIGQFGPQRDGTVNEGLTISVPKGTPIKAAENGVVAYVGDELPGFGNLILIRHAEEYVTAYAHADEIMVKKCDVVKRGQTIATAGVTGDANQPQLHFEIRKNAKPVDPSPLLGS